MFPDISAIALQLAENNHDLSKVTTVDIKSLPRKVLIDVLNLMNLNLNLNQCFISKKVFIVEKLNVTYEIAAIAQHMEQSRLAETKRVEVQRVGSLSSDSALWSAAAAFESIRRRWQMLRHSLLVTAPQQISYRRLTNERIVTPLSIHSATETTTSTMRNEQWLSADQIQQQKQNNDNDNDNDNVVDRFNVLTRVLSQRRKVSDDEGDIGSRVFDNLFFSQKRRRKQ